MPGHRAAALFIFGMNAKRVGGIEVHTREMVARLAARNCRVVLCYVQTPSPAVRQYLSFPNVTWEELPGIDKISLRSTWGLFRMLRRHRPRLLHFQFIPWPSPAAWVARLSGVRKIFYTDHNSHPEDFVAGRERIWIRLAAWLVYLPVSTTVAVSDFARQIIATNGTFPVSRLRMIHNGVDLERSHDVAAGIAFRARHGIPPERILITQVSQMIPDKGIEDVLSAASLALARHSGLHFAFVGDGKHLARFATRAIELGISDHVTWTGLSTDPVGEGVFMTTDILVLASRWQEAFGLVLAEAMSCGKPVVATRVGGIPEVVDDGKTGFLVSRRDPAALAEKFVLLARDSELRASLGRAGHERVATHFDVRTNISCLLEMYGDF
jgi:glycosyltransferase involved in cell wall biosynthesis